MSEKESLIDNEVATSGAPQGNGSYQDIAVEDKDLEIKVTQLDGHFKGKEVDESDLSRPESPEEPHGELVYTVEDAVETMGFGMFQVMITVFSGLLWLADAMELMLLSVLSPAVKCQWGLSTVEEAVITSIVFVGFLIGGLVWGVVCDQIGRKTGLLIVDVVILMFGLLSAVKMSGDDSRIPGYPWLLICRFGVGFAAGGTSQAVTYYSEFLPRKARGICITLLEVWWAIGSMFGALLALLVMEPLGWHWYLGLATIPLALVLPLFIFVPESARFYIVKGKMDKAQKVIERVAWFNCRKAPKGRIVAQEEKERLMAAAETAASGPETLQGVSWRSDGSIHLPGRSNPVYPKRDTEERAPLLYGNSSPDVEEEDNTQIPPQVQLERKPLCEKLKRGVTTQLNVFSSLFSKDMWKTTVLLLFIWLGCGWLYYGIVLLTTSLLQYDPHCHIGTESKNTTNGSSSCETLSENDYIKILWTSAAELPGLLITVIIIELIGRKLTMAAEFLATSAGFLLLFICANLNVITLFLFIIRAFATGVFQAVYVYTPEVYPTSVRGAALGLCTGAARIGALITPFVAQVLLHTNDYATISLYAGSGFVLAIAAILLPIETKGRSMKDSGE